MSKKRKVGRPSKRDTVSLVKVEKLASFGLSEEQVAAVFDVNRSTIVDYKKTWEQFSNAIKKGKAIADGRVTKSLYERAIGYSHPEVRVFCNVVTKRIKKRFVTSTKITKVNIFKHYPPDPVSCIFWLKNRESENWKDRIVVPIGGVVPVEEDLEFVGVPKRGTGNGKFKRFYN